MSTKITQDDVTKFSKYLIELGNGYRLDENYTVVMAKTGAAKLFPVGDKKKVLRIHHKDMLLGDYLLLNIFKEPLKTTNELMWFYECIENNFTASVKSLIRHIATGILEGNPSFKQMGMLAPFMKKFDKRFIEQELTAIKRHHILDIMFNKTRREAYFTSCLFDNDVMEHYGKKIRKGTWTTLQKLINTLFDTEEIEKTFRYKATIGGLLKCDAMLHVLHMGYKQMDKYFKEFMDYDVDIETFNKYIDHLERMQQLSAWLSTSTVAKDAKSESKVGFSKPSTPWENAQVPSSAVPGGIPGFRKPLVPLVQVEQPSASSIPHVNLAEEKAKNEMFNAQQAPVMSGFSSGSVPMPGQGVGFAQQQPVGQFSGSMFQTGMPSPTGGMGFTLSGTGSMFR